MNRHPLSPLLAPRSIALVGASERAGSLGRIVFENLKEAGYGGNIALINPKRASLFGQPCVARLIDLAEPPELAVIVTPADAVASVIEECGAAGITHALVLTAGFAEIGAEGRARLKLVMEAANRHGVRILGPNCVGLVRPAIGFNATFALGQVKPGRMALISQSGALITTLIDWAEESGAGFSSLVSLGGAADLDFGELLDYFLYDGETDSVLLYIEGIHDARRFMSALRALARVKPVMIMKAGRRSGGAKAVASHSGALVGNDAVFDAAIARAGGVRVDSTAQLLASAKFLSGALGQRDGKHGSRNNSGHSSHGGLSLQVAELLSRDRLALITNGGGPGVIAADRAATAGLSLATLSDATMARLNAALPPHWSHGNPIDIVGDADPARFDAAVRAVMADDGVDYGVLLFCPQAITPAAQVAQVLMDIVAQIDKPLVAVFSGGTSLHVARRMLDDAHIPNYAEPEDAVDALGLLHRFYRNQSVLRQAPDARSHSFHPDLEAARAVYAELLAEKRTLMTEIEGKRLLAAFGINAPACAVAHSAAEAAQAAETIGFPVVLKILSREITHKSDVGGVRLGLRSADEVRAAYAAMLERVSQAAPGAAIDGITVQPMVQLKHARELLVGVSTDPVFGAVIAFGAGGIAVEILADTAIGLPPLNRSLARDLIARPRCARLLNAYRDVPGVDVEALAEVLVRISSLVCACPWVRELDINPLLAHPAGAVALDARVVVDLAWQPAPGYRHLAIHPYPDELEQNIVTPSGKPLLVRPIRPEDAELERRFVAGLSPQSTRMRFMMPLKELPAELLSRFVQIDYDRELALVAIEQLADGERFAGVARFTPTADTAQCEFALTIADDWQHQSIGTRLMRALIAAAPQRGYTSMMGVVLADNTPMLALCRKLGFTLEIDPEDAGERVAVLAL